MHVRVAVVGLQRILTGIVGIHVIGHGAAVDQEIRRVVGLGCDHHAAGGLGARERCLLFRLAMDARIHFGELEQVLAVVAGCGIIVRSRSEAVVGGPIGQGPRACSVAGRGGGGGGGERGDARERGGGGGGGGAGGGVFYPRWLRCCRWWATRSGRR